MQENFQKVERLNEMPKEWQILREKILENFESKTDGLDIERMCEFMWSHNLPVTDFIAYGKEDIPKLQELFGKYLDMNVLARFSGAYLLLLDLILLKRDKSLESINGSTYKEGDLIHEMNHAANIYDCYLKMTNGNIRPRSGFAIPNTQFRKHEGEKVEKTEKQPPWGCFMEEGFAEMLRGEYMEKNIPLETKEKIQKNWRGGQYDSPSGLTYDVSEKYFSILEDGKTPGFPITAIAGTGMEMLCEKEPKLKQVLIEARNDIEKLREIPQLINAIRSGLYLEIQKCGSSQDEFARVQNIIKEAIKNSA